MQPNNQQYTNFWYYATEQEARNWFVGPGITMIFVDPTGSAIYRKSLSFDAYARPIFEVFELRKPAQNVQPENYTDRTTPNPQPQMQQAISTEHDDLKAELADLKTLVHDLAEKINSKPYFNKKEGGK